MHGVRGNPHSWQHKMHPRCGMLLTVGACAWVCLGLCVWGTFPGVRPSVPGWCNIRLWHHMYYPRRTGVRQVRRDQEGLGPPEWVTGRGLFLLSAGRRILLSGSRGGADYCRNAGPLPRARGLCVSLYYAALCIAPRSGGSTTPVHADGAVGYRGTAVRFGLTGPKRAVAGVARATPAPRASVMAVVERGRFVAWF